MAITAFTYTLTEEINGGRVYRLDAVSDDATPTFYWYEEGQLISVTKIGQIFRAVAAGLSVAFEVFDDPATVATPGYPPRIVLQWERSPGAVYYQIVQDAPIVDNPILLGTIPAQYPVERWESPILDAGEYEFSIYPVFDSEQLGKATSIPVRVVRRPDAPEFTVDYDGGTGNAEGTIG
jgi:hypothetical protein